MVQNNSVIYTYIYIYFFKKCCFPKNLHVFLLQTEEEFLENLTQGFAEDPADGEDEDDEAEEDDEDEDEEYEEQEKENSLNGSSQSLSSPLGSRADIAPMVFALQQEGKTRRKKLKHLCVCVYIYIHLYMYICVCLYIRIK